VIKLARTPALDAPPLALAGVTVAAVDLAGQIILRGDGAAIDPAAREVLGVALPLAPCTRAGTAGVDVAWLRPDRWLVAATTRAGDALARAFTERLAPSAADAHDASDGMAVIDVTGPEAAALLAASCNLDLDPRAFGTERAATTLVGGVDAVLYRRDAGFRLHVARSLAHHLWDWLGVAAHDL
jgi:sarcosine oxidase subunit gamma